MCYGFAMCGVIALVFIVTTAAEVALLVKVGGLIGALPTFGIIIATGFLGAFLAKRAGAAALLRLRRSVSEGGTTLALVDGALVLAAGVTLLSPGFLTDAAGLLLLVGPIRGVVAGAIHNRLEGKLGDVVTFGGMPFPPGQSHDGSQDGGIDEDPPPPGVIDV